MKLASDYINYKRKKLDYGGDLEPDPITGELKPAKVSGMPMQLQRPNVYGAGTNSISTGQGAVQNSPAPNPKGGSSFNYGAAASFANGVVDTVDQGNSMGRKSTGSYIAKGAISGAAAGASVGGPWGAVIGGVVGGAAGWIGGASAKKKEIKFINARDRQYNMDQQNRSIATLSADPELVTGRQEDGYYANGGLLGDPDQTLYDNTNMLISKGGNPMRQKNGSIMRPGVNSPNIRDRQLMLTDIGIYNQRPEVLNMSPEARLNGYYSLPSNNPEVAAIKNRLKTNYMGSGPVASYNAMPNIDKAEPAVAKLANGGQLQPMSKGTTDIQGPSHENGGVQIGANEVEGEETIDNGYVFSKKLGFADVHRPLAKALGRIEQKPFTPGTRLAATMMRDRIEKLKQVQEYVKSMNNGNTQIS